MRVLHVIPSLSPKDGGPSFALPLMARGLAQAGVQVDIVTTDGQGSGAREQGSGARGQGSGAREQESEVRDQRSEIKDQAQHLEAALTPDPQHLTPSLALTPDPRPLTPSLPLTPDPQHLTPSLPLSPAPAFFHFRRQVQFYKVSLPMTRWLSRNVERYDLVHIHALFSYASGAAAYQAYKHHVPYIVRPLGVLNRWGMANRRRWLKNLSFKTIERRILRNAAAIHYTSRQEQLEAEEAGVTTSPAVIPLGIDLSEFEHLPDPDLFFSRYPAAAGRKVILFLSRLDAKKGLDLLLPAFAEMNRADAVLVIAGNGDQAFVDELRESAARLKIEGRTILTGFLSGQEKLAAFAAASVFTLPSYSENFGIAAVEALAAGLPCVISDQVGITTEVNEFEAGLVVQCRVPELAAALQRMMNEPQLRSRMGANSRRLASNRFSTQAMTEALVRLYKEIGEGKTRGEN